jgi:hypothetical protein
MRRRACCPLALALTLFSLMSSFTLTAGRRESAPAIYAVQQEMSNTAAPITNYEQEPHGSTGPVVRRSPDGSRLLVLYGRQSVSNPTDGKPDPYFRVSLNGGQSWSAPTPIYQSPGVSSEQAALAFTANNLAHVVWVEGNSSPLRLLHAREQSAGGAWTAPVTIAESEFIFDPAVTAHGNVLHLVWSQRSVIDNPNIYYAHYSGSWTVPIAAFTSAPDSRVPAPAADTSGNLHVVWEEGLAGPDNPSKISYRRRTAAGEWDPVVTVSGAITQAKEPQIIVAGGAIRVSFGNYIQDDQQLVAYTQCLSGCNSAANWPAPVSASEQYVGVSSIFPYNLISDMVVIDSCVYLYYHGTEPAISQVNELIWRVRSCNGGQSWSPRQSVTATNVRSIYANVIADNQQIRLIYEQFGTSEPTVGLRQIYTMVNQIDDMPPGLAGVYLPLISK